MGPHGRTIRNLLGLAGLTVFAATNAVVHAGKPAPTPVAAMTIEAAFNSEAAAPGVYNDGKPTYVDYQIAGMVPGGGTADKCVNGEIYSTGLAFMRLNRRNVDNILCSEHPVLAPGNVARQYSIYITDADACALLGFGVSPCLFTTPTSPKQPHVRAETVFKGKATKTLLSFQFHDGNNDYHINTDTPALMTGTADSKFVTYGGTGTLFRYNGGPGSDSWLPVGQPFPLPFQIKFDRYYVTAQP